LHLYVCTPWYEQTVPSLSERCMHNIWTKSIIVDNRGFRAYYLRWSNFYYCNISGQGNRDYGRRDPSRWPRGTLYPQKLALTSPTSGSRSVDIVRSRTQATEFVWFVLIFYIFSSSLLSYLLADSQIIISTTSTHFVLRADWEFSFSARHVSYKRAFPTH
jgi:hypothetical protein